MSDDYLDDAFYSIAVLEIIEAFKSFNDSEASRQVGDGEYTVAPTSNFLKNIALGFRGSGPLSLVSGAV